ncbi:MAG: peptide chain release factor N(5)-glutamine methyltransferase [Planctomycetales bacterium]|nr:peptide chain release factor N(5)-glutamine methyltransferase [Planctomycetales bacterium]
MPETDSWTIGRLLTWTTDYLAQRGADTPRLDAEVLLAEARQCQRIELYTAFDQLASDQTRVAFRELVRRRAEGMPVAYLVGRREFYALSFYVTPDVLIPRPETEFIVVSLLDLVKDAQQQAADRPWQIADVGTGSGILAVCAARHIPTAHVLALDASPAALEVARRNLRLHDVEERVELRLSDLFDNVPEDRRFDFIVSNPPYVSEAEFDALPVDVRSYEPHQALVAGPKGTEVIERLLDQAAQRLEPQGWLLCEISPSIETEVRQLIDDCGMFGEVEVVKDLAGLPRVVKLRRNGR